MRKRPSAGSKEATKRRKVKQAEAAAQDDDNEELSVPEAALRALKALKPVGKIGNKFKRGEVYQKYKRDKETLKKKLKDARKKEKVDNPPEPEIDDGRTKTVEEQFTAKGQKTLENTREIEETVVLPNDAEVLADEAEDEFSPYFDSVLMPKIIITTRPRPSAELFQFIGTLMRLFPNSYYYPRRDFEIKDIIVYARHKNFTHLMVLSEKSKLCNGLIVCHLGVPTSMSSDASTSKTKGRADGDGDDGDDDDDGKTTGGEGLDDEKDGGSDDDGDDDEEDDEEDDDGEDEDGEDDGDDSETATAAASGEDDEGSKPSLPSCCPLPGPTAFFKISNITLEKDVESHGRATSHVPELIFNNFVTRLGHRTGRFLGSMFPHVPNFHGRQVVTLHNQRDFIFVRHHRYVFEKSGRKQDEGKTRARLQELGPRFTMKMRWMQMGGFDTKFGEYEWFHKRKEMDTTRRKFHM